MMLPNRLLRFVARMVLGSYGLQVVAPVVMASEEVERQPISNPFSRPHGKRVREPSPPGEAEQQKLIRQEYLKRPSAPKSYFAPSESDEANARDILTRTHPDTIKAYQYRLGIKALKGSQGGIQLKVSRK